ncbi:glycosyltransferase family 2 protein [Maribacter dokdonensis]|uniref:glycosyltransferase family 2 protein n=1 Tax=Maribacter dokdonensis TaxID=320912 RepID=UPI0027358567|nr:glycosyltransferase family 2 protein [Maribacter dokdonensis]MDP2527931.1 glycosyltransferase family 2 protein [Maribacter dokdonensis]
MLKSLLPVFKLIEDISFQYKFTVFIPVYNASKTIEAVFESLNAQTFKDFEVIIINDGSTDNSDKIIRENLSDLNFEHTYVNNQNNINKFGILFEAIKKAKGEFFVIHDSDDRCTQNALETFLHQYNTIPDELKEQISGVTCKCKNQFGEEIGKNLPFEPLYSNTFESSIKYGLSFEKWGVVKTRLLKSIKIDDFIIGKGMIPESFIWMIFAKNNYITKYCSDIIRIYYVDNENSLSTLKYDKKALGMGLYAIMFMNYFYKDYLLVYPKHFFKRLISLLMASKFLKYTFSDYFRSIDSLLLRMIFTILWPFKSFL